MALVIRDFDDANFNPFTVSEKIAGQGAVSAIYPELRRLRREKSVWAMDPRLHFGTATDATMADKKKWTVLAHADVLHVLTNPAIFSSRPLETNLGQMFGKTITAMDAPEHRDYRMLFQKAFAPNMLDDWKQRMVPGIVNGLVDKFIDRGHAELISEFSLHFPFQFISELLALPEADRPIFHKLAFAQTTVRYDQEHALEGGRKLGEYLKALIEERRQNPPTADDFVHVLAMAELDGERLPEIVLISFLRQLMNAAGDTSYHGFSNLMAGLLRHRDQFDAVLANRALVSDVIEEGLRWESPIVYLERGPTQRVELAGETLEPGDHIYVAIGAANRDETVHEDPDAFNIFRKKQRHMAFGQGPHICLGQHLARAEVTVALNALLDRLPNLRLDPNAGEPIVHGVTMRKPKALQVVWG